MAKTSKTAKKRKVIVESIGEAHVTASFNNIIISLTNKKGDVISLDLPMEVTMVEGHTRIEEVRNQVAVKRGPIVYCVETPDLPESANIVDIYLPSNAAIISSDTPASSGRPGPGEITRCV